MTVQMFMDGRKAPAAEAATYRLPSGRRGAVAWAFWIAGVFVLGVPSEGAAQSRHLGSFGVVCTPERNPVAPLVAAQPEIRTRPQGVTVTLVIDLPCASTVEALQRVRDLRRSHPAVEVEILVLAPAAFARLERAAAKAILAMELPVPLRWDPGRLRELAIRSVPFFRLEEASGRVVTAFGIPCLEAMLGAVR